MIKIENLTFIYGHRSEPVLSDFNLQFEAGGVYGLLGPNGAGKSTLLYLMAGALTPGKGRIMYKTAAGKEVNVRDRSPEVLEDMIMVPEEISLPDMRMKEYGKLFGALYPNYSEKQLKHNLEVMGMDYESRQKLSRMSMGQKKRAFVSFAFACGTRTVIMDEPTNGLDIQAKASFRRLIAEQMSDERLFIISTHQVRDLDQVLDRIIIMNEHQVTVNATVGHIESRLRFVRDATAAETAGALYTLPSARGADAMFVNDDGAETNVNIELLFDYALREPGRLGEILCDTETKN